MAKEGRDKNGLLKAGIDLSTFSTKEQAIKQDKNHASVNPNLVNLRAAEKAAALPSTYNNSASTSTSTNSTTVGQVVIYTQATDAQGIANAFPRALANQSESGAF